MKPLRAVTPSISRYEPAREADPATHDLANKLATATLARSTGIQKLHIVRFGLKPTSRIVLAVNRPRGR
jgi:hypothetical protein